MSVPSPAPRVLRLTIPGVPPSVNHQYVRTRRGVALTREARRYQEDAALIGRMEARKAGWQCIDWHRQSIVRMRFYWPDRRRRDSHNATKLLLDAWNGIIYTDDRDVLLQIVGAEVDRHNPRVEIEVEEAV